MANSPGVGAVRCVVTLLGLAAVAISQTPATPAAIVHENEHVRIELLAGALSEDWQLAIGQQAAAAVETAWPVFERLLGPAEHARGTIRLHAEPSTYRATRRRLVDNELPTPWVLAADGSEAHVLLSQAPPQLVARPGLLPTTRDHLLFAAAKQLVQIRLGTRADEWVSDLIGIGLLDAVVNPQRLPEVDLGYDTRRSAVVGDVRRGSVKDLQGMIGVVTDSSYGVDHREGWARLSLVAEQLSRRTPTWPQRLLTTWPGGRRNAPNVQERFTAVEAVLGKDWKRTQQTFEKNARSMRSPWSSPAGEVWRDGENWRLLGTEALHAHLYGSGPLPKGNYALHGTMRWRGTDRPSHVRILLDWDDKDLLAVWLEPPKVILRRWSDGADEQLAERDCALPNGKPIEFRLEVENQAIRILIDGKPVLEHATPGRGLHGIFGFAVGAAELCIDGLRIETGKPVKK